MVYFANPPATTPVCRAKMVNVIVLRRRFDPKVSNKT